jgi:hypothetical protein
MPFKPQSIPQRVPSGQNRNAIKKAPRTLRPAVTPLLKKSADE